MLASAALLTFTIYFPPLQAPFGTEALGSAELAVVAALSLLPTALIEAIKACRRKKAATTLDFNSTED